MPESRDPHIRGKKLDADRLAHVRENNLRQLLLRASRVINQDVTDALLKAGFDDLKNSHVFCLANIDLQGSTVVDLAGRCHISKQAVSKLVGELVELGYLSTTAVPTDGRAIRVSFMPRGHSLMRSSIEIFEEMEEDYGKRLGSGKLRVVKDALRILGGNRPS